MKNKIENKSVINNAVWLSKLFKLEKVERKTCKDLKSCNMTIVQLALDNSLSRESN